MFDDINAHYLPPGVKLVMYYDRTALVDRTVHTVHKNLLEGIALVLTVTLLFLAWATGVPPWWWRWPCRFRCWALICCSICAAFPANLISLGRD